MDGSRVAGPRHCGVDWHNRLAGLSGVMGSGTQGQADSITACPSVPGGTGIVGGPVPVEGNTGVTAAVAPGAVDGSVQDEGEQESESDNRREVVRLADEAHGQMYVCYKGPLGVHLKQEL